MIEFGTDGVRDVYEDPEIGYQVGRAAAEVLGVSHFTLVQDTRPFNPELADALKHGIVSGGADVLDLGVLPTPAAANIASVLTRERGVPYGAVSLSASHNPAEYFGIKVFGADGNKLDDSMTRRVERRANTIGGISLAANVAPNKSLAEVEFYRNRYIDYLVNTRLPQLDEDFLLGTRVILDAANGAALWSAQTAFRKLGADVQVINVDPTQGINKNSGATHPEVICAAAKQADRIGFAFDGDADRLVTATAEGLLLDGDHSIHIAMTAGNLLGKLGTRQFVSTKYSNFGLQHSLAKQGISAVEVINGDREVAQAMGSTILVGGEKSGHTLFNEVARRTNHTMSGDGVVTAIQLLSAVEQTGRGLEELAIPELFPHLEQKVKVVSTNIFESDQYQAAKTVVDNAQGTQGDNLGRLSGTEKGVGRILVRDVDADRATWAMDILQIAAQS